MGLSPDIVGTLPMDAKAEMALNTLKAYAKSSVAEIVLKSGLPLEDFIAALKHALSDTPQCITSHGHFDSGPASIEFAFNGHTVPSDILDRLNEHSISKASGRAVHTGLEAQIESLMQTPPIAAIKSAEVMGAQVPKMAEVTRFIPDSNTIRDAVFHRPHPVLLPTLTQEVTGLPAASPAAAAAPAAKPNISAPNPNAPRMHYAPDSNAPLQLSYTRKPHVDAEQLLVPPHQRKTLPPLIDAVAESPAAAAPTAAAAAPTPHIAAPNPNEPPKLGHTEPKAPIMAAETPHTQLAEGRKFPKGKIAIGIGIVAAAGWLAHTMLRETHAESSKLR